MYSMILMAALTTGVDAPNGHRGGGCSGCYGGCYGGGGGGRMKGHGRRGGGCCGCQGGGYGGGYGGCYGGGYGGGCMGMGYGGGCMGMGAGCYGGGMGMSGGCYGGSMHMMPGAGGATTPEKIQKTPEPKKTQLTPASATIVVDLPADAKLSIDNEPTAATGSSRVFVSPVLNPGREYHYTLKAEIVKGGKAVVVEKVIAVKAGQTTAETLTAPAAGVAQR